MDNNPVNFQKEKPTNSSHIKEDTEKKSEKEDEKKISSISDNIGFNKIFTLSEDNQFITENSTETKNNNKKKSKEEGFENKISIDLSDVNNKKLHNYLNEDLIDALDKSLDDPIIDNQYVSDFSHNENDTNYSQNNLSHDNDMFNNYPHMNNNYQLFTQNISLNSIHNSISFFPKANKKKEEININNNNIKKNENNKEDKNRNIKKLVDYFGTSNPLDAPVYIPQKFKSLKFNQKKNQIDIGYKNFNNSEITETDKKEEKCKKPFEIREGDWTCEFCYNLNFAFRTKCNRCGLIKDFLKMKSNLCINSNDNLNNYQNLMQPNFLGINENNSAFQFLSNNIALFSPNISNYP